VQDQQVGKNGAGHGRCEPERAGRGQARGEQGDDADQLDSGGDVAPSSARRRIWRAQRR
jgi:hypothetical protein